MINDNTDVKQERQHCELIHGLENFKTDRLKHIDTVEKIVLPNAQGTIIPCPSETEKKKKILNYSH